MVEDCSEASDDEDGSASVEDDCSDKDSLATTDCQSLLNEPAGDLEPIPVLELLNEQEVVKETPAELQGVSSASRRLLVPKFEPVLNDLGRSKSVEDFRTIPLRSDSHYSESDKEDVGLIENQVQARLVSVDTLSPSSHGTILVPTVQDSTVTRTTRAAKKKGKMIVPVSNTLVINKRMGGKYKSKGQ